MGSIWQIPRDVLYGSHMNGASASKRLWDSALDCLQKIGTPKSDDFPFLQPTILGYFGNPSLSNNCCLQPSWATTFINSWRCFGGASQRERWKVASRCDWPWESPRIFQLGRSNASYSLDTWQFQQFDQLNHSRNISNPFFLGAKKSSLA